MSKIKGFQKSSKPSLRIYLMTLSLLIGIVILLIYFKVLPELIKVMTEISPTQAETVKSRCFYTMIGSLIFIFLANFGFWKIDNKLNREEEGIRDILRMNPETGLLKKKLKRIERKRKLYIAIIEPIFIIILGLLVTMLTIAVILPLLSYRL